MVLEAAAGISFPTERVIFGHARQVLLSLALTSHFGPHTFRRHCWLLVSVSLPEHSTWLKQPAVTVCNLCSG